MKNTFIAALALAALAPFGVPAAFAADEIAHAVNAVSVFTDRAVVTRTGTAHLKKGKNEIAFSGIRDGIDLRSIRAGTRVPDGVKILGEGELTKKLTVRAKAFSATAKEKIEAAGGKAEVV